MTRREFCAALAALAAPGAASAFPVPSGAVVLDDCDPIYCDREKYADNLSFFNADGTLRTRVGGLNVCEEIGSPRRVAVDLARGRVWVAETVARRLVQFDLNGKELVATPNVRATAVAVDPDTGHAWVTRGGRLGSGAVEVFDAAGKSRATFEVSGYDIAYDPFGRGFWTSEAELVKLSRGGKPVARQKVSGWCAVSVACDPRRGTVWTVGRKHSENLGENELVAFDATGKRLFAVPLGDQMPFRVAVDPRDGSAWVALLGDSLERFSPGGKSEKVLNVPVLSFDVERATGNLWVATATDVRKMTPAGEVIRKTPHKGPTTQAWVAAY